MFLAFLEMKPNIVLKMFSIFSFVISAFIFSISLYVLSLSFSPINFSVWKQIKAGVPQGSILGPLFFLIYINDLPNNLESKPKNFADDTSLFSVVIDQQLSCEDSTEILQE